MVIVYDLRKDIIESLKSSADRVNEIYGVLASALREYGKDFSPVDLIAATVKLVLRLTEAVIDSCIKSGETGTIIDCVENGYDFLNTYAYLIVELANAYFRAKYDFALDARYAEVIRRIFME